MNNLERISEALQKGEAEKVTELVKLVLTEQRTPQEILNNGLIEGMNIIGVKFKEHEIFLPEVLMAAQAMYAGLDVLNPLLAQTGVKKIGKVVLGTVKGDLHDIGKNLVKMMLEGTGFEVFDLGVDVSADKFIAAVREHQPDIVGMSALLTTTMVFMSEVIISLQSADLRKKVKVIIGGAPVTQQYADQIGADCYSPDAATAAEDAKRLIRLS